MLKDVNNDVIGLDNLSTITIDWLSLYCLGKIKNTPEFEFIELDYSTRHFKKIHTIQYRGAQIGTTVSEPHSKILAPGSVIIKFDNKLLYSRSAKYIITKLLQKTKLKYKSITRADIARDFHRFAGNLNPQYFIQDFMKGIFIKNGRGKFQTIGEQLHENIYDYLAFGSRSTGKRIYLYNKSKELKQVGDKPHIVKFWERNGLIKEKTVWRLEFSFKGSQNKIVDLVSGLIDKIFWTDLFDIKKLWEIMSAAINDIFSFKINDGKKNKSRMPDLQLFNEIINGIKLAKIPDSEDKIKPIKTLLKNLAKEYWATDPKEYKKLFATHYTIISTAQAHNLTRYLQYVVGFNAESLSNPFHNALQYNQLKAL